MVAPLLKSEKRRGFFDDLESSATAGQPGERRVSGNALPKQKEKWFGLLRRREGWHLSLRGVILLLLLLAVVAWIFVHHAYTFLAVRQPASADILVVEGWMDNWTYLTAAKEFIDGGYKAAFVTGGPVPGAGGYTNDFNTSASVGAELLIKAGVPREAVQPVPCRESARDRTYASALALRRWLEAHDNKDRAINVMTETTHARRTWLLFDKALGPEIKVGIIPILSSDFPTGSWWRYSEGVRDVIGESIAYLYARLLFWPKRESSSHDKLGLTLVLHE